MSKRIINKKTQSPGGSGPSNGTILMEYNNCPLKRNTNSTNTITWRNMFHLFTYQLWHAIP